MKIKKTLCILLCLVVLAGCAPGKKGQMELTQPDGTTPTAQTTILVTTTSALQTPRLGYYVGVRCAMGATTLDEEVFIAARLYLLLEEGGKGEMGSVSSIFPITWDDKQLTMDEDKMDYFLENDELSLVLDEDITLVMRYVGQELPEAYQTPIPVGYFAVSSVGRDGDLMFYGTIDPENGYIRIREDGTGEMFFDGQLRAFTLERGILNFETEQALYLFVDAQTTGDGQALLMVKLDGDEVISIAFRPVEDPEKS